MLLWLCAAGLTWSDLSQSKRKEFFPYPPTPLHTPLHSIGIAAHLDILKPSGDFT